MNCNDFNGSGGSCSAGVLYISSLNVGDDGINTISRWFALNEAGTLFFAAGNRTEQMTLPRAAIRRSELLPVLKTPRLGVFMEPEVGHGETEVHARVQA